jgi:phage-related tail protein
MTNGFAKMTTSTGTLRGELDVQQVNLHRLEQVLRIEIEALRATQQRLEQKLQALLERVDRLEHHRY